MCGWRGEFLARASCRPERLPVPACDSAGTTACPTKQNPAGAGFVWSLKNNQATCACFLRRAAKPSSPNPASIMA